jgi:hypothetical protein
MTNWDTDDSGNVAAHEFGHMIGHPDEYADATCPARNPVSTGTVMDDNTETVARLYNRLATFHGGGHTPTAGGPLEQAEEDHEVTTMKLIDNLKPELRARVLDRLRSVATAAGEVPEGLGETEITFEVSGGAPGERYTYRLGVRADGTAERRELDELEGTMTVGGDAEPATAAETLGTVGTALAGRVFAAAREVGLLDDEAPVPSERAVLVPDSLVAIITVRDGDAVRRVVVPAAEPTGDANLSGAAAGDVPVRTPMRLPASSVEAWQPVLSALQAVEAAI